MPTWADETWEIHRRVVKGWKVGSPEDVRFLALALAGKVGETANLLKKIWRGDFTQRDVWNELAEELADVRVYLELLARACGYDLDECVERQVMPKIRKRWPERSDDAEA